jgi:aryl sulfotransferase
VTEAPRTYRSSEEDSGRWRGFVHRDGDIVVSTRSKSGTTWMQMICALLILRTPQLPVPLAELSPWMDWLLLPRDEVWARLEAQEHRRVIKTHTPLDGLPLDPRVTYVVVARHPLDLAVSLYHQGDNLDRERIRRLTGAPEPTTPRPPRLPLPEWLTEWVREDADPQVELDSLAGVLMHLRDAWSRRHAPNVVLLHYSDLVADLPGQMRALATRLGIQVPEEEWPALVRAATFDAMRARADEVAPDAAGVLKDRRAFFRRGAVGQGRRVLEPEVLADYDRRTALLAPADLLAWLHR